jgi:hypothetical protein
MININMTKAKEIHRDKVRVVRNYLLSQKDVEFQRALETGADTSAIVADKQALRDAPASAAIEAATNSDELKAAWDTELLGPSPY